MVLTLVVDNVVLIGSILYVWSRSRYAAVCAAICAVICAAIYAAICFTVCTAIYAAVCAAIFAASAFCCVLES